MSLPELMYDRLDRLPRQLPKTPLSNKAIGRARSLRYRRNRVWNEIADVKPMSRLKPFYVQSADLLAPKGSFVIYRDVHVFKYGTESIWKAKYVSNVRGVHRASIVQRIGPSEVRVTAIFPSYGSWLDYEMAYRIERAETAPASGVITWRMRQDSVTKNYEFGLFDDRYKPVAEYPVSGVDNAELTLAYSFSVANLIYPLPLLEGLEITDMKAEFLDGFVLFGGKRYKDPYMNNAIRYSYTVRNGRDKPLVLKHWGMPLSVLYEDDRHVSQINVDITFPDRTLSPKATTSYTFTVNLHPAFYGKIALAHAVRYLEDGTLRYAGGPCFQVECFRLLLP